MKRQWCVLFIWTLAISIRAQSHFGLGADSRVYSIVDRLYTQNDTLNAPLDRNFLYPGYVQSLIQQSSSNEFHRAQGSDKDFLKKQYWQLYDSNKKANQSAYYGARNHLFTFQNEEAYITIDPAIYFQYGRDGQNDNTIFRNTRGIKVNGAVKNKLFFHTHIYETQASFLDHIENKIDDKKAIPGQGFYKEYQSNVLDQINGWDFLDADAVVTYRPSKYFRASLGHSNLFLGSGYRSLFLSNYSDNFFFLELHTTVGILGYKNVFTELAPTGSTIDSPGDVLAPKKYLAAHYLTLRPSPNLEISLFEAVVFGRENNFELQYLNPLILYRVVEQSLDSPDNVMLGLEGSYRIRNTAIAYFQLLVDEFRISEAFSGSGWWGNKLGYQLGIKWFEAFSAKNLDIRLEYNSVRPYTYAHRQYGGEGDYVVGAYSHYNQELAHPLGASFRELVSLWEYRMSAKWSLSARFLWATTGRSLDSNVGSDILQPNESRIMDYDNNIGQGNRVNIIQMISSVSYMVYHNHYLDFQFWYRNQDSKTRNFDTKSVYFGLSFRANVDHYKHDY